MRASLWAVAVVLAGSTFAAAADKEPSFTKEVKPFLAKYCIECHGVNKPKAGFNFSSYDDLMKGSKKKKAIVEGKPDDSLLVKTLDGTEKKMPPKKSTKQPTAMEIDVVKAWIKAGAKDDSAKADATPAAKTQVALRRRSTNDGDED
jgi:mono/diheme cytochrome c family protein